MGSDGHQVSIGTNPSSNGAPAPVPAPAPAAPAASAPALALEEGSSTVTLEELKRKLQEFASARDWDPFHSPRNLLLALVGEVGELSEIFQWKGEVQRGLPDWSAAEKEHLGEELSDVLLYLTRLADVCGVDLTEAALQKIVKNGKKYPVEKCKGSSNKYTYKFHTG